jgi:hypothetical protein
MSHGVRLRLVLNGAPVAETTSVELFDRALAVQLAEGVAWVPALQLQLGEQELALLVQPSVFVLPDPAQV